MDSKDKTQYIKLDAPWFTLFFPRSKKFCLHYGSNFTHSNQSFKGWYICGFNYTENVLLSTGKFETSYYTIRRGNTSIVVSYVIVMYGMVVHFMNNEIIISV